MFIVMCQSCNKRTDCTKANKCNDTAQADYTSETVVSYDESKYAPYKDSEFTNWVTITDNAMEFYALDKSKNWVYKIEGRNHKGLSQFRMAIRPKPVDADRCYVRNWMSASDFWEYGISYQKQGFKRVSLQLYKDSSGITRYQAVWFKYKKENSDDTNVEQVGAPNPLPAE